MKTKIKVEKMPNILEDIIQDVCLGVNWLPLGQRMLKAGYKLITQKEIAKRLGIYLGEGTIISRKLDDYTEMIIPEKVIKEVRKARKLGMNDFMIHYPPEKNDPIITGGQFFIAKWLKRQ